MSEHYTVDPVRLALGLARGSGTLSRDDATAALLMLDVLQSHCDRLREYADHKQRCAVRKCSTCITGTEETHRHLVNHDFMPFTNCMCGFGGTARRSRRGGEVVNEDVKPYSKEEIANSTIWAFTNHPSCNENCRRLGSDLDHAAVRRYLATIRERDERIAWLELQLHEARKSACPLCRGAGEYTPECYRCRDSTDDHECARSRKCSWPGCLAAEEKAREVAKVSR